MNVFPNIPEEGAGDVCYLSSSYGDFGAWNTCFQMGSIRQWNYDGYLRLVRGGWKSAEDLSNLNILKY